ncbi:complement factor H-like isoform X2 [Gadus morhua]|uniref:complement factor H-like isoform X2 n=1 Tax=Gadus morhua TaxID=8049 RepID=UPI0011B3F154|nr:complement factor H-like isoform X2 [Gadus morhua]
MRSDVRNLSDPHLEEQLPNRWTGYDAQYQCREGFTPTDGGQATCTEDGWSPNPLCKAIRCQDPSDPHLEEQLPNRWVGDDAQYQCREGFTPTDGRATCTENGWTPNPLCKEIRCENPNDPNLKRQLPSKRIGDYVRYQCREGFTPTDGGQATCTENGWTPNPLCEEVTCQLPQVTGTTYPDAKRDRFSPGETVWVKCDRGRWFSYDDQQTQRTITCTGSGEWDTAAICQVIPSCNLPTTVENADITEKIQEVYNHGAEVTYACRTNYRMEGERTIRCRRGQWSPRTPTCIRVTCQLPQVNGNTYPGVNKEIFLPGETVWVKCNQGCWFSYKDRRTQKTITCAGSGQWDTAAICQVIPPCNLPTTVENADITENQQVVYNHGAAVTYACHKNYRMEGEGTIRCQNGQWSPNTPTCIGVKTFCNATQPNITTQCFGSLGGIVEVLLPKTSQNDTYRLKKDNIVIVNIRSETTDWRYSFIASTGIFTIEDVSIKDAGEYSMEVHDADGKQVANTQFYLTIHESRIPFIARSLTVVLLLLAALGVYWALKKKKTSRPRDIALSSMAVDDDVLYVNVSGATGRAGGE